MKHILCTVMMLALLGCASTRQAGTVSVAGDYRNTERMDSIFFAAMQRDSIYAHDSIYIRETDDTVYKYVERLRYQYVRKVDTLRRTIVRTDTAYVDRMRAEVYEKPVDAESQMTWYDKCCIWLGRLCCIAAILWVIFLYIKRKV